LSGLGVLGTSAVNAAVRKLQVAMLQVAGELHATCNLQHSFLCIFVSKIVLSAQQAAAAIFSFS